MASWLASYETSTLLTSNPTSSSRQITAIMITTNFQAGFISAQEEVPSLTGHCFCLVVTHFVSRTPSHYQDYSIPETRTTCTTQERQVTTSDDFQKNPSKGDIWHYRVVVTVVLGARLTLDPSGAFPHEEFHVVPRYRFECKSGSIVGMSNDDILLTNPTSSPIYL